MAVAQHQHPHIVIVQKKMKYVSQITGFDLNCKERLEMVSLGLPCHFGRTRVLYYS